MKKFRLALWAAIGIVCGFLGYSYFNQGSPNSFMQTAQVKIGGPFDLVTNTGERITDKDLMGKPHLIFFGFTNCPEICPTTLFDLTGYYKMLGEDGDKLNSYFFTVDAERDTQEVLSNYMSAFDPRIKAVTGKPENMQKAISAYRAYSKKVPLDDGDYTMDHTATIYLMRGDGSFAGTIDYKEADKTALEKIRRLIKNG